MRASGIFSAFSLLIALTVTAVPRPAAASGASRHATAIDVRATDRGGSAQVAIDFTSVPTFSARLEKNGRRLIVDVPDADLKGAPGAIVRRAGLVGGVMAQAFSSGPRKTARFLVTLLEDAKYSVTVEGKRLLITLVPGKMGILDQPVAKPAAPAPGRAVRQNTDVRDVRFDHGRLEDKIVIELSEAPRYRQSSPSATRSLLVIEDAELPEGLARTLDVAAFGGFVRSVSSYAKKDGKREVLIDVERSSEVTSEVTLNGSNLVWSFYRPGSLPPSATGVGRDGGAARRARTVHVEAGLSGIPEIHDGYAGKMPEPVERTAEADQASAFTPAVLAQQARYTGRRIDLDLKDADVHNVLRLLADVGRVNIVTADNVQGSVTIRMRNVPWDQALDVVLQAKGLGMVRQGNMIRVAPMADLEKEREMQIARRAQEAKLAPLETRLIPVSYAQAGEIQERARSLLSERGSIAVDERTNVMIVRDLAGNLNQIEELTRSLDTQTPQVLVEARIVEATSRYLRDVGIQWGGDATFSAATGNPTGLAFPNSVGVVGGASDANTPTAGLSPFTRNVQNPNFAVNLPATVGTGSGGAIGLTFGSIDNTINLAVRLSAAESSGMLRILSSPRILTLDNREARISQGTLIPFSQISAQGVQTTFQEAKLQLLVRPHVTAEGSVSMHVKINRDEPDFNQTSPRGDPTILKREAETDLLVMDGHTAVIGGIFTRNTGRNLDQVPFFGDIPLIGLLFQRRRASDARGELVIFLTPRIVNRAEALGR
jgi:type IV pilus assembly protein PilQ